MKESTQTVLLILLVAFIALAGGRYLGGEKGRPALFRLTSLAYLSLGLALGGQGLGIIDGQMLRNLEPILELALGWIGLLFGLQFELRRLGRFHKSYLMVTLFQSLVTAAGLGLLIFLVLSWFGPENMEFHWRAVILIALVGASSSPSDTALAAFSEGKLKRKLIRLVHYITSLDSVLPLVLFAFMAGYFHTGSGGGILEALEWLAVSVLTGLVLGFLFYSYARHRHNENELVMMIIAFTVFSGGIAAYLNLSSLFINVVLGATLANLLHTSEKIFRALVSREKPILIVLLILVGAQWIPFSQGEGTAVVLVLLVYLAGRVLAKALALRITESLVKDDLEGSRYSAGLAILGQGGMSIALVANYQLLFGGADTLAIGVILVAVVISEAFSAYAARFALVEKKCEEEV